MDVRGWRTMAHFSQDMGGIANEDAEATCGAPGREGNRPGDSSPPMWFTRRLPFSFSPHALKNPFFDVS
jgi:hypothetical protein